jgi:cell wall-associated NlpC family hydrolase
MANRIITGAVLTLALILSPMLAQAVPTKGDSSKGDKKKSSSSKTQSKSTKKKKSSSRSGSTDTAGRATEPVRGDVSGVSEERTSRKSGAGVSETPPLMKVTPQRDGRFLLEPLSPKKPGAPLSTPRISSPPPVERVASAERNYNRFEPWNFSELILTQARHYKDAPYARGSSLATGSATDCSGFVQFIYKGFKIDLPRSSAEQAQVGKVVTHNMDFSKLLPGDLLFFRRGGRYIGHAGIYIGEGKMIHASNRRYGVTITDLRQPYYEYTFVVAKRVFEVKYQ